jgi:hypothetical protein
MMLISTKGSISLACQGALQCLYVLLILLLHSCLVAIIGYLRYSI